MKVKEKAMKMHTSAMSLALLLGLVAASADATMVPFFDKTVSDLQADSYNPCIFFKLSGVTEANPAVPNDPWFAIDNTQSNAKELYAILLSARLADRPIARVLTNGVTACGYARVTTIDL